MPTILRLIGEPKEVGPLTISAEWDDHRGSLAFIGRKRDEILIKVFNPVGWELKQQGEKLLLTVWRTKKMPLERVNFLIPQNWQRFSSCQLVGPKVESIREAEDWVRSHN
jgi:hypothetical protein